MLTRLVVIEHSAGATTDRWFVRYMTKNKIKIITKHISSRKEKIMCGIFGYIGPKPVKKILIDGLEKLEYRGYDSAGIAFMNQKKAEVIKNAGKVQLLKEKLDSVEIVSTIGIAHTRWATHGQPNSINAHPHKVGNITLVHNGILENVSEKRIWCEQKGITFQSETDSEVIAALIYLAKGNTMLEKIETALQDIKGSYALAILCDGEEKIYVTRKDSPLLIGIGEKECYLSSDLSAIPKDIVEYLFLEEKDIVILEKDHFKVYQKGKEQLKLPEKIKREEKNIEEMTYEHKMLKEIEEEPEVVTRILNHYLKKQLPNLEKYSEIHIVGCGSAYYAGEIGKYLLETYAHKKVLCEIASEYRYKNILYEKDTLVILVSQSGETADTIAAMRKAKESGIQTLSIVNVLNSTIARESDQVLYTLAGEEIAVATTKVYVAQVLLFSLLTYQMLKEEKEKIREEYSKLSFYIKKTLERDQEFKEFAKILYTKKQVFFIGRQIDYALAREGSLKLKEISYLFSEAYPAGELKHGTISLIEKDFPVLTIVTDSSIFEKTLSNIEEVKARGANVLTITNQKTGNLLEIVLPKIHPFLQFFLVIPCLQKIAYDTAKLRNCPIDQPKNLAKSVTVE